MTNLRSIFSILALLLSSQGAQLVASQAQSTHSPGSLLHLKMPPPSKSGHKFSKL